MKRTVLFGIVWALMGFGQQIEAPVKKSHLPCFKVDFDLGYFFFENDTMRQVYDGTLQAKLVVQGFPMSRRKAKDREVSSQSSQQWSFEGEGGDGNKSPNSNVQQSSAQSKTHSSKFVDQTDLFIFATGDYLSTEGQSLGGGFSTRFSMGSATLGLGANIAFPRVTGALQLMLGPNYFYARATTDSPYVAPKISSQTFGVDLLASLYFKVFSRLDLNVFGEYAYKPSDFSPVSNPPNVQVKKLNVGGWTFGGGLGVEY